MKKTRIDGYSVCVFVPVREASDYWRQPKQTAEEALRIANDLRDAIKRHLSHDFSPYWSERPDVEVQSQDICEHCGSWWTEKSGAYNGGCCAKDEAANPDQTVIA